MDKDSRIGFYLPPSPPEPEAKYLRCPKCRRCYERWPDVRFYSGGIWRGKDWPLQCECDYEFTEADYKQAERNG